MSLSRIPSNGRVAVIGAGISGLTFSYFLTKLRPDIRVSIFESQQTSGGWIKSKFLQTNDGASSPILFEKGPRTLRGVSDGTLLIVDILKQLGSAQEIEVMKASSVGNRKYLVGPDDSLCRVPHDYVSALKFFSNDITNGVLKSVLQEPFSRSKLAANGDESISSFFQRRFGSTALSDNILSAVIHGIYAGNVSKLSVKSVLPALVNLEKEHGSVIRAMIHKLFHKKKNPHQAVSRNEALEKYEELIAPKSDLEQLKASLKPYPILKLNRGLQQLTNAITSYFINTNPNVSIIYGSQVSQIDPQTGTLVNAGEKIKFDHIRSTINTNNLAKLITNAPASLSKQLSQVEYISIYLVNVYCPKEHSLIPPKGNGFGFLVPKSRPNHECLLGIIYDSDTEKNVEKLYASELQKSTSQDYDKITLMFGGHFYNDMPIPSTGILTKSIKSVLAKYLNVPVDKYNLVLRDESSCTSDSIAGLSHNDLLVSYNLHKNCIPQFNVGYSASHDIVKGILASDLGGKLSLGGMCFGNGVGVPDCVMNGLEDALKLA